MGKFISTFVFWLKSDRRDVWKFLKINNFIHLNCHIDKSSIDFNDVQKAKIMSCFKCLELPLNDDKMKKIQIPIDDITNNKTKF